MLCWSFFILLMAVERRYAQINSYSDIELFSLGTQFQPANSIELFSTSSISTVVGCSQLCNQNVQCRTFDYDPDSLMCRLFEGAVETGSLVPSASPTSLVGAVYLQPNLFAAFGQDCAQCTNSRYLVCLSSNNNTCQCPTNTMWNGVECKNQGYENANCSNNQWCRQDLGLNCSKLKFCTEYRCNNMTIVKADLPSNDLTSTFAGNFSMCCSSCESHSGCKAFTWVSSPGMFFGSCYLKTSKGGGGTKSSDHISAYY